MAKNMMCPAHKASNKKSREGWERTFGNKLEDHNKDCSCDGCGWKKEMEISINQQLEKMKNDC
jgi:hypothetical protein